MKSSLINPSLLRILVRRFVPLWVAVLGCWLIGLVVPLALFGRQEVVMLDAGWIIEYGAAVIGALVSAGVTVACVFEQNFDIRAAQFYGSMPASRQSVFVTCCCAGLLPLLAIVVVIFGLLAVLSLGYPNLELISCVKWAGIALISTVLMFSVAALCAQVTGTRAAYLALFALANVFVAMVESLLRTIGEALLFGVDLNGDAWFDWLSPAAGLLSHGFTQALEYLGGPEVVWPVFAGYFVAGLVLMVVAALLYGRRNLERAGDPVTVTAMSHVLQGMIALACAALAGLVVAVAHTMQGGTDLGPAYAAVLAVVMALVGFVSFVIARNALFGDGHALARSWKGGLAISLACVALVGAFAFDVLGVASYVPADDDVESIVLLIDGEEAHVSTPENVALVTEAHQRLIELGSRDDENFSEASWCTVAIDYYLTDGSKVSRSYHLKYPYEMVDDDYRVVEGDPYLEAVRAFGPVMNSQEGRETVWPMLADESKSAFYEVTVNYYVNDGDEMESITLKKSEVTDFFENALKVDVLENGADQWIFESTSVKEGVDVDLSVSSTGSMSYYSRYLSLSEDGTPAIAQWLYDHYGLDLGSVD